MQDLWAEETYTKNINSNVSQRLTYSSSQLTIDEITDDIITLS